MGDESVLRTLEQYYDTVPRATADVLGVPGFTVFVATSGWSFYGRPVPGKRYVADDVLRARAKLAEAGVPDSLEWVEELAPTLRPAAAEAGMTVHRNPLLVLAGDVTAAQPPPEVQVEILAADDSRLSDATAAVAAGFHGTDELSPEPVADSRRQLARDGLLVTAGAFAGGEAVGGGTHAPRQAVTELLGIATLPSMRRRGVGAAVTAALAADARSRGAATVFLSAGSDEVARVYERVGFVRVGTACVASG